DYLERMELHLLRHGMPSSRLAMLGDEPTLARAAVRVPDALLILEDAGPLVFAGATWRIVATPGHADGHISLYDEVGQRLIAGDHLLERISPAVGKFPDHAANPLRLYLDSLKAVAELDITLVHPGHGKSFSHARARCEALLEHHEYRLDACILAIANGATTTWQMAQQVFGSHHDPMNERFTVTEALAHLSLAHERGLVSPNEQDALFCEWVVLAGDRLVP
ncbi:MAG: MBL fold metallo-hydrolase, partial [Thermoleophilia bacterium]|nr:MBL fold metallo-hydrolase [Thermoleophilia bacterium]